MEALIVVVVVVVLVVMLVVVRLDLLSANPVVAMVVVGSGIRNIKHRKRHKTGVCHDRVCPKEVTARSPTAQETPSRREK